MVGIRLGFERERQSVADVMTEVLSDSASGTESLKCGRVSDSSSGDALENGASGVNGSDPGRVYSGRDTINISLPDMYHVLPIYLKKTMSQTN